MFGWFKRKEEHSALFEQEDHPFHSTFNVQIESWCYGLSRLEEEIVPGVVHRVIKELSPLFAEAIGQGYPFDIVRVAENIHAGSNGVVEMKEIVFNLLAQLPAPLELDYEQKCIFAAIVAQVERNYGGAVTRMKRRWNLTGPIAPLRLAEPMQKDSAE